MTRAPAALGCCCGGPAVAASLPCPCYPQMRAWAAAEQCAQTRAAGRRHRCSCRLLVCSEAHPPCWVTACQADSGPLRTRWVWKTIGAVQSSSAKMASGVHWSTCMHVSLRNVACKRMATPVMHTGDAPRADCNQMEHGHRH